MSPKKKVKRQERTSAAPRPPSPTDAQEEEETDSYAAATEAGPSEPPSKDDLFKQALGTLIEVLGNSVDRDKLERSLEVTYDDNQTDFESWIDAAQIHLAVHAEVEDEAEGLREAMDISLAEAQERKASERPLVQRPTNEILAHFQNSELLTTITKAFGEPFAASLFESSEEEQEEEATPLRRVLIDYLTMEANCTRKWYPCSKGWFVATAEKTIVPMILPELGQQGAQAAGTDAAMQQTPHLNQAVEAPRETQVEEAKEDATTSNAKETSMVTVSIGEEEAGVLLVCVTELLKSLEESVYAIDVGDLPSIFEEYRPKMRDEIELLDEEGG